MAKSLRKPVVRPSWAGMAGVVLVIALSAFVGQCSSPRQSKAADAGERRADAYLQSASYFRTIKEQDAAAYGWIRKRAIQELDSGGGRAPAGLKYRLLGVKIPHYMAVAQDSEAVEFVRAHTRLARTLPSESCYEFLAPGRGGGLEELEAVLEGPEAAEWRAAFARLIVSARNRPQLPPSILEVQRVGKDIVNRFDESQWQLLSRAGLTASEKEVVCRFLCDLHDAIWMTLPEREASHMLRHMFSTSTPNLRSRH